MCITALLLLCLQLLLSFYIFTKITIQLYCGTSILIWKKISTTSKQSQRAIRRIRKEKQLSKREDNSPEKEEKSIEIHQIEEFDSVL